MCVVISDGSVLQALARFCFTLVSTGSASQLPGSLSGSSVPKGSDPQCRNLPTPISFILFSNPFSDLFGSWSMDNPRKALSNLSSSPLSPYGYRLEGFQDSARVREQGVTSVR
ncbi:unnamed protein product [Natator depressus]